MSAPGTRQAALEALLLRAPIDPGLGTTLLFGFSVIMIALSIGVLILIAQTRRREQELLHRLRRRQELLHSILDGLPLDIVRKDTNHRILDTNQRFRDTLRWYGVDIDPIGRRIGELGLDIGDRWRDWERQDREAMSEGGTVAEEYAMVMATETRYLRYVCSAMVIEGEVVGVLGVSHDVTDTRRVETELADARRMESIGQLSAGIAHEINTPVQFVSDNTRFLADTWGDVLGLIDTMHELVAPDARDRFDQLLDQVDLPFIRDEVPAAIEQSSDGLHRVTEIVRAMKDFSHPGRQRQPTDLNQLIRSTLTVARNEWKYVAEVRLDLDRNLPLVPVEAGRINQAVLNLVVNAAHAIADGGGAEDTKGLLTVTTSVVGPHARIEITDDGVGMTPEVRARIFDRFFTTKEVGRGTGQGLALVHDVVTSHDGRVDVATEPGRGTTFTIDLPLDAAEGASVPPSSSPSMSTAMSTSDQEPSR